MSEADSPIIEQTKSDTLISRSMVENIIELNDGSEIKIYSYEVKDLPKWFDKIEKLPDGYGFMGGVARGVLLKQLGNFAPEPRDLDVVGVTSFEPDKELATNISEKYMTDDYSHGHGVSFYENTSDYFESRDFTLNEVLYINGKLYFSDRGIHDLEKKIIRPSEFEAHKWKSYKFGEYGVSPKLAVKALLLQAEFLQLYGKGSIEDIQDWQWNLEGIPPFYLALGLEKAQQKRISIPFYVQVLDKANIVSENLPPGESINNVRMLAYYVRRRMLLNDQTPFDFSNESLNIDPEIEFKIEEAWEEYYDKANEYSQKIRGLNPRERVPKF